MFEVVKAIHRTIPLKYGDLVTKVAIGPKGHGTFDRLHLSSKGPHDLNQRMCDELIAELQRAGFQTNLDTRPGNPPLGGITATKGRKSYYIGLYPEKEGGEGDIEVFPKPGKGGRFGLLERKLFPFRFKKLLARKRQ